MTMSERNRMQMQVAAGVASCMKCDLLAALELIAVGFAEAFPKDAQDSRTDARQDARVDARVA